MKRETLLHIVYTGNDLRDKGFGKTMNERAFLSVASDRGKIADESVHFVGGREVCRSMVAHARSHDDFVTWL